MNIFDEIEGLKPLTPEQISQVKDFEKEMQEKVIPSLVNKVNKTSPKPAFYAVLYAELRQIAISCGYALAIHGSMARDMDLIAVAWTDDAVNPSELVDKLMEATATTTFETLLPKPSEKPHGRICYTLSIMGDWFIDLSVIPPLREKYL